MRKQLLITGLGCALVFASTPAVLAKTVKPATDHQRIEALEARVAALEQRLGMPPATTPPPATPRQPSVAAAPAAAARALPATAAVAPPTAADWGQLHLGMDPREVAALIGPPQHKQVRPMSEIWFYPDQRQLEFDRNGRLDSWIKP